MEKRLFTTAEAAQSLGIGRTKVYELMAGGRLPSVKIGTRRLIPAAGLDEYVKALANGGEAA